MIILFFISELQLFVFCCSHHLRLCCSGLYLFLIFHGERWVFVLLLADLQNRFSKPPIIPFPDVSLGTASDIRQIYSCHKVSTVLPQTTHIFG